MAEQSTGTGPESIKGVLIVPVVLITMVAGGALALVNAATVDRIEASKAEEKREALKDVMPSYADDHDPTKQFVEVDLDPEKDDGFELVYYAGIDGAGRLTGWGVESKTDTAYSGDLSLVFGVDPSGTVTSIRVLDQKETPGLGTKVTEEDFLDDFWEKSLGDYSFKVVKDGGDVVAISGATISSRAVSLCIEQGLKELEAVNAKGIPAVVPEEGASDE